MDCTLVDHHVLVVRIKAEGAQRAEIGCLSIEGGGESKHVTASAAQGEQFVIFVGVGRTCRRVCLVCRIGFPIFSVEGNAGARHPDKGRGDRLGNGWMCFRFVRSDHHRRSGFRLHLEDWRASRSGNVAIVSLIQDSWGAGLLLFLRGGDGGTIFFLCKC